MPAVAKQCRFKYPQCFGSCSPAVPLQKSFPFCREAELASVLRGRSQRGFMVQTTGTDRDLFLHVPAAGNAEATSDLKDKQFGSQKKTYLPKCCFSQSTKHLCYAKRQDVFRH